VRFEKRSKLVERVRESQNVSVLVDHDRRGELRSASIHRRRVHLAMWTRLDQLRASARHLTISRFEGR